jgi:Arc/MetJ-type ribon-helix-helix transcriptional regulator
MAGRDRPMRETILRLDVRLVRSEADTIMDAIEAALKSEPGTYATRSDIVREALLTWASARVEAA